MGTYTSPRIQLKNVRLSFPNVFKKGVIKGKENNKFDCTFLLDKDTHAKEIKKLDTMINTIIKKELDGAKVKPENKCLRDGDLEDYDGYENQMSLKASNDVRPVVKNRDGSPIIEEDGIIYAGCYVHAIITLWVQDNQYGKKINANLLGLVFYKDGEPFGGSHVASEDDFAGLLDDEEEDDILGDLDEDSPF